MSNTERRITTNNELNGVLVGRGEFSIPDFIYFDKTESCKPLVEIDNIELNEDIELIETPGEGSHIYFGANVTFNSAVIFNPSRRIKVFIDGSSFKDDLSFIGHCATEFTIKRGTFSEVNCLLENTQNIFIEGGDFKSEVNISTNNLYDTFRKSGGNFKGAVLLSGKIGSFVIENQKKKKPQFKSVVNLQLLNTQKIKLDGGVYYNPFTISGGEHNDIEIISAELRNILEINESCRIRSLKLDSPKIQNLYFNHK
ncbi:MAG: hypothetical protein ACJA2S_001839 [Cyclobacteriaceae bacterium]|jgi:hypothetical protein